MKRRELLILTATAALAQERRRSELITVSGAFEVKLAPLDMDGEKLARMRIDKTFHGPLEAKSRGQMMSAMTEVKGSAAYVALERVEGALQGRVGSFVLHHTGVMDRGAASLSVKVVPDSGAGALTGIKGTMAIRIVDGKHFYDFEYSLPD